MTALILAASILANGAGAEVSGANVEAVRALEAPRSVLHALRGTASWYRYRSREAAAGPSLRRALGLHWRGHYVSVNGLRVRLTDWCACPSGRLIDLDIRTFARLTALSRGVVRVSVSW